MGVPVRLFVDVEGKEVDMSSLTPLERITVGLRYWWINSKTYKTFRNKSEGKRIRELQKKSEEFKTVINKIILKEIQNNRMVRERISDVAETEWIDICISRNYKEVLEMCLKSGDFVAYNIEILEEDKDVLKAFRSRQPIIVRFSKRIINEEAS